MTSSERITILAGAGLCKDAGLPTSVELAENLKSVLLHRDKEGLSGTEGHLGSQQASSFLAAYRFLNGGVRFREGMLDRDPDPDINIEQVALAAYEIVSRHDSPLSPYISGWHHRLVELEGGSSKLFEAFLDFIYSQVSNWLRIDSQEPIQLQYIEKLVEVCDDGFCVDIFTLNYDLCIETALSTLAHKEFENGFTRDGGWQPSRFDSNDCAIRLYKLHGSLDWVEDHVYGVCSLEFPRHEMAADLAIMNLKPLLIFGTAHKLSPREPFLTLAHAFSQCVLHTTVLVIVGYSFGDDYVNEIIRQGIERNPRLRVLIVSPSASTHAAKHRFLKHRQPRVTCLDIGAQQALNEGEVYRSILDMINRSTVDQPFVDPSS